MNRFISKSNFYHQALVTVTPAFLSPTSAKPRIATPLLVRKLSFLVKKLSWKMGSVKKIPFWKIEFINWQELLMSDCQVTSAIAKLFRDFATLRPASEPLSRPNPLEGKTVKRTWSYFWSYKSLLHWGWGLFGLGAFPACLLNWISQYRRCFLKPPIDICLESKFAIPSLLNGISLIQGGVCNVHHATHLNAFIPSLLPFQPI